MCDPLLKRMSQQSSSQSRADGEDTAGQRFLRRRRYLMATGGLAGVSLLAGCTAIGSGEPDSERIKAANETPADDGEKAADDPGPGDPQYLEEKYPGLTVFSADPENAEAAARETYTDYITPREEHYIRNHYLSPRIDEDEWSITLRLRDEELEISMREIKECYSTESVTHTMQCSGNGRSYFDPEASGDPWTYGAVGNTIWTGAPLCEILENYDAETSDGMWLMVAGADNPEGEDVFARSIPMQKVMEDCILAYEMNGQPMTAEHGFPVRIIVPGWYGNNNVKWVAEMEVMDMMMYGEEWEQYHNWQQDSYRLLAEGQEPVQVDSLEAFETQKQMDMEASGEVDHPPYIYDQLTKSLIGYPCGDRPVSPREQDGMIEIVGVAWAGDDAVERVEVSFDEGDTWETAELFGPDMGAGGWRQFRYLWDAEPGEYTIVSRATDEHGRTQPRDVATADEGLLTIENDLFPWNQDGYCCNAYLPDGVTVTVEE
ncbi:sulfite oxidase (plasmid) [Haloferacaceae archaeon DSL9]